VSEWGRASESECLVALLSLSSTRTACSLGVHIGQIDKLPSRDVLSGGIKQTMDGFGEITPLQYLSLSLFRAAAPDAPAISPLVDFCVESIATTAIPR
jgi:hypothetical protein